MALDALDLKILRALQTDASLSNVALARRVGLSLSPCLARVKALQDSGLIQVMACYLMTGDADCLIRVAVADMAAREKFILEQLSPMPEVEKIRSSFTLKQVRYKTALPV